MAGCSTDDFSEDELTPKAPLYVDLDLTEVARVHSSDMVDNGCFQHESCDGTDAWTRIGEYYTDASTALGENIAAGYGTARTTVLSGWMCSHEGHRANIMSGDFNEMGAGVDSDTMTQDFAGGELVEGAPPVRMAVLEDGTYYADWGDDAAPAVLSIVRDGRSTPMAMEWGAEEHGIYPVSSAAQDDTASDHSWSVSWQTAAGGAGAFPAVGAFDDAGGYTEDSVQPVGGDDVGLKLVGCATVRSGATWGVLGLAVCMAWTRRRSTLGA